ncbi:MAG: hypothetical protein IKC28_05965 [Clostridia bacterium]|nr:hypothetical protein [Clostridia bacterium]
MSNHLNEMKPHHAPQNYPNAVQYAQPMQNQECEGSLPKPHANKPKPRKGRFRRFARGYFQITGALVNLYVLIILLVQLLILLGKHFSLG